ncbi:uncharacterized protein LOC111328775 [Stylophora pistillata]|uniref:uncharacterized protein LOC111328775 n=1 Tax=Stylophora pistillata TaxID=50429 RepID=UPI000C04CD3C|nr:uncharacterized protein LOC111328775 [Stylophora pistillata]
MAPPVEKLTEIVREIMEWAGVDCSHKIEKGDLTLVQHIRQEILKVFATAERENGKGTITNNSSLICELQNEVEFHQAQCYELREELKQLKEKLKLCEEKNEDLQAEVGKQLFLESKEMRCKKICEPSSEHGRATGAQQAFSCADLKQPDGRGLLDKSGFLLQQRLQEISHSLSELELSRIKTLVQPKLNSFRLARIREGSNLFDELEKKGEFSCSFVRDLLRRIHRFDLVEKLAVPFHNGDESYRGESYPPQDSNQQNEVSESVSSVDGKLSDEVKEREDIFDNIKSEGEVQLCNSSNLHPFNNNSEVVADTFHPEIMNESRLVGDVDLSKERCDSASSLSQSFDATSIGEEYQVRSQSPSVTGEQFEGGELKGACAPNGKRDKEGSHDSSFCDDAERQFYFKHRQFNDTDGAVNLPDIAHDSFMPEDFDSMNQDFLPYGNTTQRQNVSGSRITAQKDTATDQSDSQVGSQSIKWEHVGARPRDRLSKTDRSPGSSLFYSLEDLVPPQVAGPMAHGVTNAFLARHSEDKHLHENLYYTNAEKMFTENPSLQGAIHIDGMLNLIDSNKAELNFGECQFASRPDPYCSPHSSFSPQAGGVYIVGNNGSNTDFNLVNSNAEVNGSDSRLLSGSELSRGSQFLPVTVDRDVLNTSGEGNSSSIAVYTSGDHLASGHYRERSRAHYSSSSGLISGINTGGSQQSGQTEDSFSNRNHGTESVESRDSSLVELEQHMEEACALVERVPREREEREQFGQEIERKECEVRAERVRKKREREERETGAGGGLPTTTYGPFVVESLNSTHNSPQAWLEGIEAAKAKVCFQASGPCRVRPQGGHDKCSVCLQDSFSGLQVLPCSHKIHLQCIVRLIQGNVLLCPSCLHSFFPQSK